jgi:hypothetical protein
MNRRVQAPDPIPCARSFGIALPQAVLKHTHSPDAIAASHARQRSGKDESSAREIRRPKAEIRSAKSEGNSS